MSIAKRYLKTLELDKILELLSAEAFMEDAKASALKIEPETDFSKVEALLSNTEDAYIFMAKYTAPNFAGAKNVSNSLRRASAFAVLSIRELIAIADTLRAIRAVKAWRENCLSMENTSIEEYFDSLIPNKYLEDKINFAIKNEDELNDNASSALYDIRRKILGKEAKLREILEKIIKGPTAKYLQEAIVTQRDGRFVVPVKVEYKGQVNGIVHDTSATGVTIFVEPMSVVETNNEIRVLKLREKEEIDRILAELSSEAGSFCDGIISSYEALCKLDLIFAKAKLAYKTRACIPKINKNGYTYLKNARHPLINSKTVVPITVELGKDYNTLVITGPNTGGKTVTLKTIGLLTLMTMCGLMVPCDDGSQVAVFRSVFADIGDEQSIEQSLSTFSSHMVNIISILEKADDDSLVLFDELCAGTDPIEGAALAKAILMQLSAYGSKTVSTTHYPELKSYAIEAEGVENASCEFDVGTLKPTYRLIVGMPGRSNAFAISGKLGLPDTIIETAKQQVKEEDLRFEKVVASLERARRQAEKEHDIARKLRAEMAESKRKSDMREHELAVKTEKLMEQTRQKADAIIENARNKASVLLNELEDMKKAINAENAAKMAEKARGAYRSTLKELENEANPVISRTVSGEKVTSLNKGDIVIVADINRDATVVEVKPDKKQAYVMAGAIKMWTDFDNLRLKSKNAPTTEIKKTRNISRMGSNKDRVISGEINLIGKASDEAIMELDNYIDTAILSGLETIRIIHGKGTGILRKNIQAHLRHHNSIDSFRLGTFGEGENGVTIATLKG